MGTSGSEGAFHRDGGGASWPVRAVVAADAEAWLGLRDALWPGSHDEHAVEIESYLADPPREAVCLVAEHGGLGVVGFAELALRASAWLSRRPRASSVTGSR